MTKKDFVAIAEAVRDARWALHWGHQSGDGMAMDKDTARVFNGMAKSIAGVLALQNPKFKRKEFLAICGVVE